MRHAVIAFLLLSTPAFAADTKADRIDAIAKEVVSRGTIPGLAIAVSQGGRTIFARGYGRADLENDVNVSAATSAFNVASITKNFTAAAILKLADRNALSLDDDIGKFLPELPLRGHGVTIRRLLNHTAGVHSVTSMPSYWAQIAKPVTPDELIAIFKDAPLDFEAGTRYAYSNSGYILLGRVIEKASGMSYGAFLEKELFQPLAMTHTSYCSNSAIVPGRVHGYSRAEGGFANARHVDWSQGYAAGAVCSSASDLLVWQQALHHGRVVSASSYAAMIAVDGGRSYGFGIGTGMHEAHRVFYHAGGIFGFDAMMTDYPDDDVAVVVLANADGDATGAIEARIARAVLAIPEPISKPLPDPSAFAGTYRATQGFNVRVFAKNGELFAAIAGDDPVPLQHLGDGVFAAGAGPERIEIRGAALRMTYYGAVRFEAVRQ